MASNTNGNGSVLEACGTGDRLTALRAMRDKLAGCMDDKGCTPQQLAAASKQLSATLEEIEKVETSAWKHKKM